MEKDKLKNVSQRRQSTISTTIAYAQFPDKFQLKLISEFLWALILPTTTKEV